MDDNELLIDLYYNKKNFDGINNLYLKAKAIHPKIKKEQVKEFLEQQETHQMNFQKVERTKFLPIYSDAPYAFQLDLTFFPRYKKQNEGYWVLFTAININTRYAYAYAMKDKTSAETLKVLQNMLEKTEINAIETDEGSEFTNYKFKQLCQKENINVSYFKGDSHKLGIINRFHRTLKDKLNKYMVANDTVKWVDVIDELIKNYNNTKHSGIHNIEPNKVNGFYEALLIQENKEKTANFSPTVLKYEEGTKCRIINNDNNIYNKKSMDSNYSNEIYTIMKNHKNTLTVRDENNNDIKVKKVDILPITDNTMRHTTRANIKQANKEHKIDRILKDNNINQENIVYEKRERKRTNIYDL